jgi:hypothetical protein
MSEQNSGSPTDKLISRAFNIAELHILFQKEEFCSLIGKMESSDDAKEVIQVGLKILGRQEKEKQLSAAPSPVSGGQRTDPTPEEALKILAGRRESLDRVRADLDRITAIQATFPALKKDK